MMEQTAAAIFRIFTKLPTDERTEFYRLMGEASTQTHQENFSYEEVFGHLKDAEFTSREAADYLEVSMSTLRRFVRDGKLEASSEVGRSQLFATEKLRAFKRLRSELKG
jgi:excisionase family DNA binding protein